MRRTAATAFLAMLAVTGHATAATFGTYVYQGEDYCSLDLHGPDKLVISAEKANGVTGEVWLELMDPKDRNFSTEYELRLEITTDKDLGPDAFLGGTADDTKAPGFLLPLSIVGDLASVDTFTYKIEDRPEVSLKGLTEDEVKKLVDCMQED